MPHPALHYFLLHVNRQTPPPPATSAAPHILPPPLSPQQPFLLFNRRTRYILAFPGALAFNTGNKLMWGPSLPSSPAAVAPSH